MPAVKQPSLSRVDSTERSNDGSPVRTFRDSVLPRPEHRDAFVPLWRESNRFEYLGGNALFTSFRIFRLSAAGLDVPRTAHVGIVNPRSQVSVGETAALLGRTSEDFLLETLLALTALHDSDRAILRVHLLDQPVHQRVEKFEGAMFVTPYQGANYYHTTHLHPAGSPDYRAEQSLFADQMSAATETIDFGVDPSSTCSVRGDGDLNRLLETLGSDRGVQDLRQERDRRFVDLWNEVVAANRRQVEYF